MKLLVISCLVALAAADVKHLQRGGESPEASAVIQSQAAEVNPDSFAFNFETSNGIKAREQGQQVGQGDGASWNVQGENTYTAPGGEKISIQFVADENGYQPTGSHLPTPPAPQPIPEYILRSLEYISAHPPKDDKY